MSLQEDEMESFLMASIGGTCDIGGATTRDLMAIFCHLQPFIHEYFLEEYHVLDMLIKGAEMPAGVERLEMYKELVIDGSGFVSFLPKINVVMNEKDEGNLIDAPVVILEKLVVNDFSGAMKECDLYSKFTLLDIMDCFFSDLGHALTSGS